MRNFSQARPWFLVTLIQIQLSLNSSFSFDTFWWDTYQDWSGLTLIPWKKLTALLTSKRLEVPVTECTFFSAVWLFSGLLPESLRQCLHSKERRQFRKEKKSENCNTSVLLQKGYYKKTCVLWSWPAVSLKEANIKLQLCRARGTWFSCTYKINFSKLHFRVHTMQPSPFPFLARSLVHIKLTRLPQTSVAFGNWSGSKWAPPWNLLLATKGPNSHLVGTFVKIKIEKHCFLSTVGINFTQISFPPSVAAPNLPVTRQFSLVLQTWPETGLSEKHYPLEV